MKVASAPLEAKPLSATRPRKAWVGLASRGVMTPLFKRHRDSRFIFIWFIFSLNHDLEVIPASGCE